MADTFTPGPWQVDDSKASKRVIYVFSGNTDLAVLLGRRDPSVDPMIADAYLMAAAPALLAAAPALLAACNAAADFLEQCAVENGEDLFPELTAQINAAIAKAILPGAEGGPDA